jgi:hypothetical protein
MNNTLKAILKQKALKYPTVTAADLYNTISELAALRSGPSSAPSRRT